MKNKLNGGLLIRCTLPSPSPYRRIRFNQKGSLFIGLIITMVILSTLGGAMVYIFSSSTFENVVGNFSQRAYYAAESGMRFAVATYRNSGDHATGQSRFNALNGQTIPLPKNNGQASLTIVNTVGSTAIKTTTSGDQTINLGGDLVVTDTSQFPPKNGYFAIVGVPGKFFHYKEKSANTLKLIAGGNPGYFNLPSNQRLVVDGTQIAAPKNQAAITSTGTYPTGGLLGVSRTTEYGWVLSGLPGETGTPVETEFDPTKWSIDQPRPVTPDYVAAGGEMAGGPGWGSWGQFKFDSTEQAILVTQMSSVGGQKRFLLSYNQNYFPDVWISQGQYLSYDTQVKVKTYNVGTSNHLYNFMAGLSFRLDNSDSAHFASFGASFKKGNEPPFDLPYDDIPYIVLWRDKDGQTREMLAYKELTTASGIIAETGEPATIFNDEFKRLSNWDSLTSWQLSPQKYALSGECAPSNSTYLTLTNGVRINVSSQLQFKHKSLTQHNAYSNYIVNIKTSTDDGLTWSDWSQLTTVSPQDNWTTTSIPLSINPPFQIKLQFQYSNNSTDTTTYDAWSIDDVSIMTAAGTPTLVDWSTILVRINELSAPSTTTNSLGQPSIFLGQRVNEIEIFYGSEASYGTGGNTNPRDNNRFGNPRCTVSPCAGNWPPRNLAILQGTDDKFTLVSEWQGWRYDNTQQCKNGCAATFPLRTSESCQFELAGGGPADTGNPEYKAIIRTNCRLTNSYTVNSEVGLSAFGTDIAGSAYFDDFGINIWGEGGIPYIDMIEQ